VSHEQANAACSDRGIIMQFSRRRRPSLRRVAFIGFMGSLSVEGSKKLFLGGPSADPGQ
jgi:hypothetical protein